MISENTFFTRYPNRYDWGEPAIDIEVSETTDGFELTLTTDRIARCTYLYTDNENDCFEDNYIDLIPGFPKKVAVRSNMTYDNFNTTLKYQTL